MRGLCLLLVAALLGGVIVPASEAADEVGARRQLTLRDRNALGLNAVNVARVVREAKASGEITKDSSTAEVAVLVADKLIAAQPEYRSKITPEMLDAIIEFIERLLELLVKYMPLLF